MKKALTTFSTLALSLGLITQAQAYTKDKVYHLTVLHTNDLHGHFWTNSQGEYGLAAQKTLIDAIRAEVKQAGGEVILLNAGDFNTGVPESDLQNAKPDIEGMNDIGYEAVVLGNHEFDNPIQLLEMQESWAKFPLLSANVYNLKTGKLLVKPYTILEKDDLKIAVIGLTTEDTAKLGNPEYTKEVKFDLPIPSAEKVLAELNQNEKPDIKIALTHMGYYPDAQYGSNAPGDVTMARTLPKGAFDMIIGGHSHDAVCMKAENVLNVDYKPTEPCQPDFQNGTWIMQAGEWGKYVGRADFEFKNGELTLKNYQLLPINLKKKVKGEDGKSTYVLYSDEIAEDPTLKAKLKAYQDEGDKLLGIKVGELKGKLEGDRNVIRFHQTNLGRLIAEAQRQRAQADVGIMNSGGIRDSIQEGDVTYKDILKVQPFGNIVSYFSVSGKSLLDYLNVVAMKEVDSGAYPQFAGISMTVNYADKKVENVKIQGKDLVLDKMYRVSVPSYCAAGGDGYPVMTTNPTYVDTGFVDAEVLKEFFMKQKQLDASQFEPKNDIIYKK